MKHQKLLAMILVVLPVFASASGESYFDYFYGDIALDKADMANAFKLAQDSIGKSDYRTANSAMTSITVELKGAADIDNVTRGELLADAATVRAALSDSDGALKMLDRAVNLFVGSKGPYTPLLFNVLMVQGMVNAEVGNYAAAEVSFRRAQHIVHREDGVFSRQQLPAVEQLAIVDQQTGAWIDSDQQKEFGLLVNERNYGENSEALVPVLDKLGKYFAARGESLPNCPPRTITDQAMAFQLDPNVPLAVCDRNNPWLQDKINDGWDPRTFRIHMFDQSIDLYERSLKILKNKYGPTDLRLVEPLKGIAVARLMEHQHNKDAERAMEQALAIVNQHPETDISDKAIALVTLGDVYTVTGDSRARDVYLQAWNLLGTRPELQALRDQFFNTPQHIFPTSTIIQIPYRPIHTDNGEPIYCDVEFSVDVDGKPRNVKVTDGNVDKDTKKLLAGTFHERNFFRPRIENGEIVKTDNLSYRQNYVSY